MIPVRVIEAKREGERLPPDELEEFLRAYLEGTVEDYQMAAFLMAVVFQGMDRTETERLVHVMLESGTTLDLSRLEGPKVDKHSTGGVGDKVSLVLAPLAAELGLLVPMMSGRGLGHTTGTLDKLEAIPGFRTQLGLGEFVRVLERVGCAMIGQTADVAPLDRRLYALRDVTGTVPAIPLIAASIMSKKLAEGLDGLLLDVKAGRGAFIGDEGRALQLARTMVGVGADRGLSTVALVTAMDRPLGRAIGNGLETVEAIACLRGDGPGALRALVVREVAEMLVLGGLAGSLLEALERASDALASGAALERFRRLVEAQGGDPSVVDAPERLVSAPERRVVTAERAGIVRAVEPRPLGEGVVRLGGGRRRMGEAIDPAVGFVLAVGVGDDVAPGQPIGEVHARTPADAEWGAGLVARSVRVAEELDEVPRRLVSHRVTAHGVELLG